MSERTMMLWAAIVAGSCVLALGGVFGLITLPVLQFVWRDHNDALSWTAVVINALAQFLAAWILHALGRRSSGRRAEVLRMAFLFALGYASVMLFVTAYSAALTPLAVFVSNATQLEPSWPLVTASLIIPVALAAIVLTYVFRGGHVPEP